MGGRGKEVPENTAARDALLALLAAQAEELGLRDQEQRAWGLIVRREEPHSVVSLKYRLDFDQNRWHASVQGCVRFSVPLDQEERVLSFCSTPHRLDRTQGRRWRFLPDAREPELRWIAKEFRSSYTRKLWPFLQQISSPAGLLAFMVNEYQPSQLASANVLNPFRSAALVLESRLPPEQAAQALARLSAAEHAFRIRWAARQGAPPT